MFEVFVKLSRTYCFGSMWLPFSNVKDFTYLFPGILRITEVNIAYTPTDKLSFFPSACPFKFFLFYLVRGPSAGNYLAPWKFVPQGISGFLFQFRIRDRTSYFMTWLWFCYVGLSSWLFYMLRPEFH